MLCCGSSKELHQKHNNIETDGYEIAHENSDVFNTLNEKYLVFTSKKLISSMYNIA